MKLTNITLLTLTAISAVILSFTFKSNGYEPGSEAMDFNLKNIDGKIFSLKDNKKAKGFIVVFTCNHCPYAVAYEDRIIALNNQYKKLGYPVIAINPNDSVAYPDDSYTNMIKRAKEKGFNFPYLLDESQEIAKSYGALKTPHVYLLKKVNKKLIVQYTGAIDDNYENANEVKEKYLENALNALIANKEVAVKTTKAIGCGIKWKK
ncbi:MAG: thioredoxin family protein [Bacteroidota bacterium]|nr:thioredoxin family protein [Bacteroidota bacterium]